jgi:hypothetical protein
MLQQSRQKDVLYAGEIMILDSAACLLTCLKGYVSVVSVIIAW